MNPGNVVYARAPETEMSTLFDIYSLSLSLFCLASFSGDQQETKTGNQSFAFGPGKTFALIIDRQCL